MTMPSHSVTVRHTCVALAARKTGLPTSRASRRDRLRAIALSASPPVPRQADSRHGTRALRPALHVLMQHQSGRAHAAA